jgi:hypothetical protein
MKARSGSSRPANDKQIAAQRLDAARRRLKETIPPPEDQAR